MVSGLGVSNFQPPSDEPEGTVFVFLDESFEPFVAAAAVVIESNEVDRLDSDISDAYQRMQHWYHLDGLPSFADFREHGFHATSNPPEVQVAFVALLAEVLSFKSLIIYSDRSANPEATDKRHLMIIFDQLVRDVLRMYRSRPKIIFYFESAQAIDQYVSKVVSRALSSFKRNRPEVEVRFGTKRDPDLLAVPDYVLLTFNRLATQMAEGSLDLDPRQHAARSFRAILGSVSMIRSLDEALVVDRSLQ